MFIAKEAMLSSIVLILILPLAGNAVDVVRKAGDVPIQWINCSTWTDQLSIEKVESNLWPPKRNQMLIVSVSGAAKETFIYGNYKKTLVYRGYALPSIVGPLNDLGVSLPVHRGPVKMILLNTTIPEVAPEGQYDVYVTASEQDNFEIFCVKFSWEL